MPLWGARIVVVDDDLDHLDLVTLLLTAAGAQVVPVSHPGQALATISGVRPDLVTVDVVMPGLDGLALWRKVRTLSPERGGQVPGLTITAGTLCSSGRLEWYRAGFQACLSKPFVPEVFLEVADRLAGTVVERRQADPRHHRLPPDVRGERRREQGATDPCVGPDVIKGHRHAVPTRLYQTVRTSLAPAARASVALGSVGGTNTPDTTRARG